MATVIERERPTSDRNIIVGRDGDSGAGMAVALIVLVAVIAVAAFAWVRYNGNTAAPATGGSNINVTLPDTSGGTGGTGVGGDTSGGTGGTPATPAQ